MGKVDELLVKLRRVLSRSQSGCKGLIEVVGLPGQDNYLQGWGKWLFMVDIKAVYDAFCLVLEAHEREVPDTDCSRLDNRTARHDWDTS